MPSGSLVVAATGDLMLLHPISPFMTDPPSAGVIEALRSADVAVGNCEVSGFEITAAGPVPEAEAGGLWLNAEPAGVADLAALGFTMMSRANNHATDFGVAGMEETNRLLTQHRIAHAGTGGSLAAARAPAYVATRAGRVALVSATDTAPFFAMAGHARHDVMGRPGVNQIRAQYVRVVDRRVFNALATALRMANQQARVLGELAADGRMIRNLGPLIVAGDRTEQLLVLNQSDVADNLEQVRVARSRADHVLFALHTHLPKKGTDVPRPIRDFVHQVIEAGADMVIGHGPHALRGIEVWRGRPIFYSLGNFVCHLAKAGCQPADFYDTFSIDTSQWKFTDLFAENGPVRKRLDEPGMWESVIARVFNDAGKRRWIELLPIDLCPRASGSRLGTPRLADARTGRRIIERLAELSAPFGTVVTYADGIGVVECGRNVS